MKSTLGIWGLGGLSIFSLSSVCFFGFSWMACSTPVPEESRGETSAAQTPKGDDEAPARGVEESSPCTPRHRAYNLPCIEPSTPSGPSGPSAPSDPAAPPPVDPDPPAPPSPPDAPAVCDEARASQLGVMQQQCVYGGVLVTFGWTSANKGNQWIDVAFDANALFTLDTSRGFQGKDLGSRVASVTQMTLAKSTSYAWRINTIAVGKGGQQDNWCPSALEPGASFTTIDCP